MVDRSVRVVLSAQVAAAVAGFRAAEDAVKSFARQGQYAKTEYANLENQLRQTERAARDLGLAGNRIGSQFRGSVADIHGLIAALRGVALPPGGLGPGFAAMQRQIADLRAELARLRAAAGQPLPLPPTPRPGPGGGPGPLGPSGSIRGSVFSGSLLGNLASQGISAGLSAIRTQIKDTITATADFETTINTFGAVTKSTGPQLKQVSDLALKLGADITISGASASDAAVAMTELAKGGLSVADSMTAAKGTLQLAGAAGVDAGKAADIVTSALAAFSLKASEAGHVGDILANTANAARGNMTDFAEGLKYAGATAHLAGWSLEQTNVVLGLLAKNGLTASVGGATVNMMLLNMLHQSKPAAGAIKELGLTVYDAGGKFITSAKLTDQLAAAQKRMKPEAFNAAIAVLGGSRAIRGFADLAKEGTKQTGALTTGFQDMTTAVHNGAGAAAFSTAKMKGLGGAFANLQNQVETAQVTIGEKFSPALQAALNKAAEFVPKIVAVITGPGISKIGDFFKPLVSGAYDLIKTAWPYVQNFAASLGRAWGNIIAGVKPVIDAIGGFFHSLSANGSVAVAGTMIDQFGQAFYGLYAAVKPIGEAIGGIIRWISGLPAPLLHAIAALGVIRLIAPLVSFALRTLAVNAAFAASAVGAAGLASGLGRFAAFLSGPWGLAVAGAVTALAFLSGGQKDAGIQAADFSDIIDAQTGKLVANAAAIGQKKAADEGVLDATTKLGLGITAYSTALLGTTQDQDAFKQSVLLAGMNAAIAAGQFGKLQGATDAENLKIFTAQLNGTGGVVKATGSVFDATGKVIGQFNADTGQLADTQRHAAQAIDNAAGVASAGAAEYDALGVKALGAGTSIAKVGKAATDAKAPLDNALHGAAAALQKMKDLSDIDPHLYIRVDSKGVGEFFTAATVEFDNFKKQTQDAQTAADLFFDELDKRSGRKLSLEEQNRQVRSAFTAVGGTFRDEGANAAALKAAQDKVAKDRAAQGQVDKQGQAVAGSTPAELADDYRALYAAQVTVKGSTDAENASLVTAAKAGETVALTLGEQALKAHGYAAGSKVVVDTLASQKKAMIDTIVAGKQASMSDDEKAASTKRLTAEATTLVDTLGIFPDKKETAILLTQVPEFKAGAAAAKKAVDDASKAKLKVDTADATASLKKYGNAVWAMPTKVKTKFDADVVDAKKNGLDLYTVYDSTKKTWTAQFLTDKDAESKIKAGGLVREYDTAKGTWTAVLDATTDTATATLQAFYDKWSKNPLTITTQASTGLSVVGGYGKFAGGGGIDGPGAKGQDSVLLWGAPGEHMLTAPEVDKMGGQGAVYAFRKNLMSAPGLAAGGAVGNTAKDISVSAAAAVPSTDAMTNIVSAIFKAQQAAMMAMMAGSPSGLLASNDPESWGWRVGQNIVPFSFQGVDFPGGVAGGTEGIWRSFLAQLVPMIPGGIRPGEDWGYENRDNVNSPGKKSMHAYGLALDVNSTENPNMPGTSGPAGSGRYQIPASADALATRFNMLWGGRWGDAMHFELHEGKAQVSGAAAAGSALSSIAASIGAALGGSGVQRWSGTATQALQMTGQYSPTHLAELLHQMDTESSGNPQAINLTDRNAQNGTPSKGLMQVIDPTFRTYAYPGYASNIWDPLSNILASIRYGLDAYGSLDEAYRGVAYASGGLITSGTGPRADDVNIRASRGEFVVNANATRENLPWLAHINGGYASGGVVLPSARNLAGYGDPTVTAHLAAVLAALDAFAQAVTDARSHVSDLSQAFIAAHSVTFNAVGADKVIAQKKEDAAKAELVAAEKHTNALLVLQSAEQKNYRALQSYASRTDALTVRLGAAQANLDSQRSARASLAGSVSSTSTGFGGGLTGHADTRNTFATFLRGQQYDLMQEVKFKDQIKALRKQGFDAAGLADLSGQGAEAGGVTATALLQGGKGGIGKENLILRQMRTVGKSVGDIAGDAMYGAGIKAGQGLVNGINSQLKFIARASQHLADVGVLRPFAKALAIHSPSQVFHQLGQHTATGYANGVMSKYDHVQRAVQGMVSIPRAPQWSGSSGAQAIDVQVFLDGQRIDDRVTVRVNGAMVDLAQSARKSAGQPV